jgi:hypothetical protein
MLEDMGEDIDMTMKEFMVAIADRFEDMEK